MIRLYNGGGPPRAYSTISGRRCTFLLAEYSTKESSTSPTFLVLKVLWKCSMTLEQPYLQWVCTYLILFLRKGGPHWIQSKEDPDSLMFDYQSLASIFWGRLGLHWMCFRSI